MQTETPKFNAWLAAEKEAQALEGQLHVAMLRYAREPSAPRPDELAASARALRQTAHGLFAEAMQELKGLAESLHHRRILPAESPGARTINGAILSPPTSPASRSSSSGPHA